MDTQTEVEDRARAVLKRAGIDLFMEIESLAVDQKSDRVFIVLKRKGSEYVADRTGIRHSSTVAGGVEAEQGMEIQNTGHGR